MDTKKLSPASQTSMKLPSHGQWKRTDEGGQAVHLSRHRVWMLTQQFFFAQTPPFLLI